MPKPKKRKYDIFRWLGEKRYSSKGWAERKVKDLKDENKFYRKHKGKYGPNHWNTEIKIIKKGRRYIVKWKNHMKIPKIKKK